LQRRSIQAGKYCFSLSLQYSDNTVNALTISGIWDAFAPTLFAVINQGRSNNMRLSFGSPRNNKFARDRKSLNGNLERRWQFFTSPSTKSWLNAAC
jgi:hypothetical protein